MTGEILTVAEMAEADRLAVKAGVPSLKLMENAGRAVADAIAARFKPCAVAVLCGPGNNGGDGFAVARHLKAKRFDARVALLGAREKLEGDAAAMAKRWHGAVAPLGPRTIKGARLIVDALFGVGLSRPLEDATAETVKAANASAVPIVSIDVPSGLSGDLGRPLDGNDGLCVRAEFTVTFFRKKPAHLLMPGRLLCGETIVADIGIPASVLQTVRPRTFENTRTLWNYPWPDPLKHKYARGACVVVSGPAHATGAARLAARGALRIGAGLVSVASPEDAVLVNAAQLTAIMVKPFDGPNGLSGLLADKRLNAAAIGPGCGVGQETEALVQIVLASKAATVLDADALTSFAPDPLVLFQQLHPRCVLTPHEGEFERIFPDIMERTHSRLEGAREAAKTAKCVVVLKGPDTIIAAPDGRAAINANAPEWLATAGAGDVLTGFIAGLLAQHMQTFEAACAGVWLHGEAAKAFGPGLIAEDLPEALPAVLRALRVHKK